jgi:hypothetical protein
LRDMLRAEAAGRISREFIISNPTHWIEMVTMTAIRILKRISIRRTFKPRLRAKDEFILTSNNLLNINTQKSREPKATNISMISSLGLMLNMSPIRKREYLVNPPPRERITIPKATAVEENTPIIVSAEVVVEALTIDIPSARRMEKASIAHNGSRIPKTTPMAIPVKAEWPKASEKKAILLLTTMVPKRPNRGVTNKTANRAFCIKMWVAHS